MSRNLPDRNSPGRELAIQDAHDLAPATFRRLVASRYRRRVDSDLAPVESEAATTATNSVDLPWAP
ncbi:MAG: hypothetical protein U1A77_21930 [Pirellulales bacterium]